MGRRRRYALIVAAALVLGCATRRPTSFADAFIRQGEPSIDLGGPALSTNTDAYLAQLRKLAAEARPRPKIVVPDVAEVKDPALRDRLAALRAGPTAERYRDVALEYRRLGILDATYAHLSTAIRLDSKDASSYDLRARVWRAWGLPQLGLRDARKAVALAPKSATAWNTLGLLLEGSGNSPQGIKAYLRSATLDGDAGYAWTNLCRAWTAESDVPSGVQACRRALSLDPTQHSASLNLQRLEQIVAARVDRIAETERVAASDAAGTDRQVESGATLLPSRALPYAPRRVRGRDSAVHP